jgi:O-antigen/teichoic acid export membrane protein
MTEPRTEEQLIEDRAEAIRDVLDSSQAGGRIIRGGSWRLASYVGIIALSVISASLLTRHLGLVRFGEYTTVMSLVGVVGVITDSGMASLGTREFAMRHGADRELWMQDLLGLRVALTMVGVVLSMVFVIAAGYSLPLLAGTLLASLATVVLVLQHTFSIPLSAELRIGIVSLLDLGRQALSMVTIVALVLLGAGLFPLLAVTLAVNAALVFPTAALVRGKISLKVQIRPSRWPALIRLTVAFALATAVGTIYVYAAQILTSLVANPHQSGLFAASFRVFIAVAGIPGLLVGGALPLLARAARDDRERLAYALTRIFEVSLILGVAAATGFLAGARFVIMVIGGSKYADSIGVLQIQGLAMIASFALAGWSFALVSLNRFREMLVANAAALAVSCGLTLSLAAVDGARGAAIATVCGETTLAVGYLVAMTRGHPEFRPPMRIVAKVALAGAPAATIALAVDLPSLPRTLVALAVYGLIIILTRAIPSELIEQLPWYGRSARV